MKKTLLLTLALGLASAASLLAGTVDVYIAGSTAFRQSVYVACTKLYSSAPSIWYASAANGGADSKFSSSTGGWVMSGTPVGGLSAISGNTLVVHGLFTGSVQGVATTEANTPLTFAQVATNLTTHPSGTNTDNYVTASPTIGFSDASSGSMPFPLGDNNQQEDVCVQPFVMVKSCSTNAIMNSITNYTWDMLNSALPNGRIPFSAWSGNTGADNTNNFVYLIQRTQDSGTRLIQLLEAKYLYGSGPEVYIYDATNNFFFLPPNSGTDQTGNNNGVGKSPFGVVGAAGLGNANLTWGPGYVSGGNIATMLCYFHTNATAVAFLSLNDAKSVFPGSSANTFSTAWGGVLTNWNNVIAFNGLWPTAAGPGIHGNSGTNDFTPIAKGAYPLWGKEVLVALVDPKAAGPVNQNITSGQLGDNSGSFPGSFLEVFNHQTFIEGGSPLTGSIENEVELSKTPGYLSGGGGATAIRLSDMTSTRGADGGTISLGPIP